MLPVPFCVCRLYQAQQVGLATVPASSVVPIGARVIAALTKKGASGECPPRRTQRNLPSAGGGVGKGRWQVVAFGSHEVQKIPPGVITEVDRNRVWQPEPLAIPTAHFPVKIGGALLAGSRHGPPPDGGIS
jgi:hypothetical protein